MTSEDEFDAACKAVSRYVPPQQAGAMRLCEAIEQLGAELTALRAREKALVAALRERCIKVALPISRCNQCEGQWTASMPETHKPDCIAAPTTEGKV